MDVALLVRARVNDLDQIPQLVVLEDPDNIGGDSFSVQCELLRHKQPNDEPLPQDPIPKNNVLQHPMPFDFIGLGQPAFGATN